MKSSFGVGIAFLPFGLLLPTQYVLASNCAVHLSDVASEALASVRLSTPWFETNSSLVGGGGEDAPVPALTVTEDDRLGAGEAAESDGITRDPKAKKKASKDGRGGAATNARALPALFIPASKVLRLANSGARPTGRAVTPEGARPAGVQVFGASALGVGVRDGDVITRVSGVPVTSPNQIIGLVIAARGARQSVIVAQLYRGQRTYMLTVEQPYIDGAGAPQNGVGPAPLGAGPGEGSTNP